MPVTAREVVAGVLRGLARWAIWLGGIAGLAAIAWVTWHTLAVHPAPTAEELAGLQPEEHAALVRARAWARIQAWSWPVVSAFLLVNFLMAFSWAAWRDGILHQSPVVGVSLFGLPTLWAFPGPWSVVVLLYLALPLADVGLAFGGVWLGWLLADPEPPAPALPGETASPAGPPLVV